MVRVRPDMGFIGVLRQGTRQCTISRGSTQVFSEEPKEASAPSLRPHGRGKGKWQAYAGSDAGLSPKQRFKLARGYNAFAGAGACTSGSAHIRPAESANHVYGAGSSSSRMGNQTRMRRR